MKVSVKIFVAGFGAACVLAAVTIASLIPSLGRLAFVLGLDVFGGVNLATAAGWLVWKVGLEAEDKLVRWGIWELGGLGLIAALLLGTLEGAIVGGHPLVLLFLVIAGAPIVAAGLGLGAIMGLACSRVLRKGRWLGYGED